MRNSRRQAGFLPALAIAAALLTASGCATNSVIVKDTAKVYPATASVEILHTMPQRSYNRIATVEAVGTVNSSLTSDRTALLKQLGDKAKAIGADAVIITDEKANVGDHGVTYVLTGTAIKYATSGETTAKTTPEPAVTPLEAEPVEKNNPPAAAKPAPSGNWLKSQPPQHFTIQLTASRSEQALQRYVEDHNLNGKVASFKTRRNGEIWYALVYGSYPTRKEALAAIKRLPSALRKTSPFTRKFADITKATVE